MNEEISISIALTNISDKQIREDALDSLHGDLGSKLMWPNPPSGIAGGSIDLWATASKISDVLQIGLALWAAYDKFIRPRVRGTSNQGLYVVLPLSRRNLTFWLGEKYRDKASFLKDWTSAVKQLRTKKKPASKLPKRRRKRT